MKNKLQIENLLDRPNEIPTVVRWIQAEWPKGKSDVELETRLCGLRERWRLPQALIALDDSRPIGFVSLVRYEDGVQHERPHWIDALYVEESHRGRGVARQLLDAAERLARELKLEKLFALTEIADFYLKAGWVICERGSLDVPQDVVVTKTIHK